MTMKINLKLLNLKVNFQGLFRDQVSQAFQIALKKMQPGDFLALAFSALEDKKRESHKLKLLTRMIYGCKV